VTITACPSKSITALFYRPSARAINRELGRCPCHHHAVHVSGWEWAAIASVVLLAATVQGVVGFGSNLLAVPFVALIVPAALPGAMIFPGLPMTVGMTVHERDHVDRRGSRYLILGRIPGTVLGVAIVAAIATDTLAIVIGAIVLLAVLLSVVARRLHPGITATSATTVGVVTGITGTAAAIDGPPLALLYQNDPAPIFRSTLAAQFTIGTFITLVGLLVGGQLHLWQVALGVSLWPSYLAGLALSLALRRRLAHVSLRPAVLIIAALTGAAAIIRAVL
jgi:uncharacterized membrane protein YfcA